MNRYGLSNPYPALVFPHLAQIFYTIMFRSIITRLPREMRESGGLDGVSEFMSLFRIIDP